MSSLHDAAENAAMLQRIEALRPDSRPSWGKLTVVPMLAHCQQPFLVAAGELNLKRGLLGLLFGRLAKKKFVDGERPFGKNGPTDPRFLRPDADDFERERDELRRMTRRYGETGATTTGPHPFFGPMTREDWNRLMWKHLDHHLRQFGV